jgi:ABC-type amino acid transport substrate-binding protein
MLDWFRKPQYKFEEVSEAASAHATVLPPPLPRRFGWRLGALGKRLQQLAGHALNAEKAFAASQVEVEARTTAMATAIAQTRQRMSGAVAEAESLRGRSIHDMEQASEELGQGLDQLQGHLDGKVGRIGEVVSVLERIGKELELLALNAAIQAAGAGEAGRSFIVVSDHIRKLAQETVANSKRASQLLDFGELSAQLGQFREASLLQVADANQVTVSAFDTIGAAFAEIRCALDKLDEHGRVVGAMHQANQAIFDRQRLKIEWVGEVSRELAAVADADDDALDGSLQRLVATEKLQANPTYDRLTDIRQRGLLRVALEPAFKGLSFRLKPGDALRGLDVDYATAFARHLGVKVEFVEYPWDQCTELLHAGNRRGNPEADVVWSALPPNAAWQGVAFSDTYTWLRYVLARRKGDSRIDGVKSLEGKVLGCINDPAALATLEAAGLRWGKHLKAEPGTVRLANLICYSDQSVIHDALADGIVDAFAVDQPIFAWACYGNDSPWRGRIEMLPDNLAASPWYYAAGVADAPSSAGLLAEINRFLTAFKSSRERQEIEKRWQYEPVQGAGNYRDEPGRLRGDTELQADWLALQLAFGGLHSGQ